MNQSKLPEVVSWAGITLDTNSVNLHAVLYRTAEENMVYLVKGVLRGRTRNAIFVRLACHLVKVPFLFVSQQNNGGF